MDNCLEVKVCDLLLKIQDHDEQAFEEFYDLTYKILYQLSYSYLKVKEDAEDALSNSYLQIYKNIYLFKGKSGFNWIYTITKNTSLNLLKSKKKNISMNPSSEEDMVKYSLYTEEAKDEEFEVILETAKQILKPIDFQIILLHIFDDLSFKEIGQMLKINESTARGKYNSSIKKIQSSLERSK